MDVSPDKKHSLNLSFIVIGVLILSAVTVVFLYNSRKTKKGNPLPPLSSSFKLTPTNLSTTAGATQTFTATYSETGGWENITDASFYLAGGMHDQWLHYNPTTKSFGLKDAAGGCMAGQTAALSTDYLTLNCGASSVPASGTGAMITFSLTPKKPSSATQYRLFIFFTSNQPGPANGKFVGTWTIQ